MSALPHVVWDMGGILYPYFTEMMLDLGRERGWPLDRLPLGPTGLVDDPDYHRLLEGELDEPDYLLIIRERLRAESIDFDPPRDLAGSWISRESAWNVIRRIGEMGHRQAILTNDATRWLGEGWWEKPGWEEFDVVVDVVQVGSRKPSPEPYLAVADALGVPPSECLFIDDLPVNCRGAEAVGMRGHLFVVNDAQDSLHRLLGLL